MARHPVALLGAGRRGAAMVGRWTAAGRFAVVWNRQAAAARALADPDVRVEADGRAALAGVAVAVTSRTGGAAVRSVLDRGALAAMAS